MFKMKKLLAGILAAATVFSMSTSAFAAEEAAVAPSSEVSGITSYESGVYNKFVTLGTAEMDVPVHYEVRGMTEDYKIAAMDRSQAQDVTWTVIESTITGIAEGQTYKPVVRARGIDGYTSAINVDVSNITDDGYAMIQADYTNGGNSYTKTVDFGLIINPGSGIQAVEDITCIFDPGVGEPVIIKLGSVGASDIAQAAKYPNALYATKLAAAAGKGVSGLVGVDSGYITSITVNGTAYVNDYTSSPSKAWKYSVKNADGKPVYESSSMGAGILPIGTGYTIEWNYK